MTELSDNEFLFTSESVTEGHPDKIADQISDGVLDAVLRDDPYGRVACETLVNTGLIVVSGEISTNTYVDIQEVARETVTPAQKAALIAMRSIPREANTDDVAGVVLFLAGEESRFVTGQSLSVDGGTTFL